MSVRLILLSLDKRQINRALDYEVRIVRIIEEKLLQKNIGYVWLILKKYFKKFLQ